MADEAGFRSGFVALVGRPNVGKSTLLNRILGQKISITSSKPQTTRHRILGIDTRPGAQVVYVDTPGLHRQAGKAVNRYMNRVAASTLSDVDVVVLVCDAGKWTDEDDAVVERLAQVSVPVIAAVNKVDRIKDKTRLLPFLESLSARYPFVEVVPISATDGSNVDRLQTLLQAYLPEGSPLYPEDQVTDRSERFLASELVREKLMRALHRELPYALTVSIDQFADRDGVLHIDATIWVERESQKSIVIGKGGAMLKQVGRQARVEMEKLFGRKVFLRLWAKTKEGWSDDERALRSLGYSDDP